MHSRKKLKAWFLSRKPGTYLSMLAICLLAPLLHVKSEEGFFTVKQNVKMKYFTQNLN